MQVQTTHGPKTIPGDYAGKWLVLFSHPADFTPVCTTEFVSFQKNYDKFREMNTELLGLSVDQVFSHIKWTEWIKEHFDTEIEFPIIADTGLVSGKLGSIQVKTMTLTPSVPSSSLTQKAKFALFFTTHKNLVATWMKSYVWLKAYRLQKNTKLLFLPTGQTVNSLVLMSSFRQPRMSQLLKNA